MLELRQSVSAVTIGSYSHESALEVCLRWGVFRVMTDTRDDVCRNLTPDGLDMSREKEMATTSVVDMTSICYAATII